VAHPHYRYIPLCTARDIAIVGASLIPGTP
jgi:hypothetical protein